MNTARQVEVIAPAKLNLGLAVLGRRKDGFSDIDTIYARLELHDRLMLQPAAETSGEVAAATGIDLAGLKIDRENIVVRAVEGYRLAARIDAGVRIVLEKRIPLAAGLGGGSSDAAAALKAMARLFPAGLSRSRLRVLAAQLGSDVPFFLEELPAARGSGRGEVLQPLQMPHVPVVLANPRVAVSAGEAYSLVRAYGQPLDSARLTASLASKQEPAYRNDLQPGVCHAHPEVKRVLEGLSQAGLRGVLMSGSGSTCFGFAGSLEHAREVARSLVLAHPDWWVWWGLAGV